MSNFGKNNRSSNVLVTLKSQSSAVAKPSGKRDQYNPFISTGYVSLSENSTKVPIEILQDTGATQSLLVEGISLILGNDLTGSKVKPDLQ